MLGSEAPAEFPSLHMKTRNSDTDDTVMKVAGIEKLRPQ